MALRTGFNPALTKIWPLWYHTFIYLRRQQKCFWWFPVAFPPALHENLLVKMTPVMFWKVTAIVPCKPWELVSDGAQQGSPACRRKQKRCRTPAPVEAEVGGKLTGVAALCSRAFGGGPLKGSSWAVLPWKASQHVTWCKLLGKRCDCVTEMAEPQCSGRRFCLVSLWMHHPLHWCTSAAWNCWLCCRVPKCCV